MASLACPASRPDAVASGGADPGALSRLQFSRFGSASGSHSCRLCCRRAAGWPAPGPDADKGDIARVDPGDAARLAKGSWQDGLQLQPRFFLQAMDCIVVDPVGHRMILGLAHFFDLRELAL